MLTTAKRICILSLCALACLPCWAQLSIPTPSATPTANGSTDPLNRTTPSSAVLGFLQAASDGNYTIAAQYLQMSAARRQSEGEQIAQDLQYVLDHTFAGNLSRFSQPEGIPQEGISLGHQKMGTMSSGDVEADLDLVRVNDPNAGKIWLISAETVAKIPELYEQASTHQVEHKLPGILVKHKLLDMPLWQWLGLFIAIAIAIPLGWLLVVLAEIPLRIWARRRGHLDLTDWKSVSAPAWLLASSIVHRFLIGYLGLPLLQRHYYFQILSIALLIGGTWILWRIVRWSLNRVRNRALSHGQLGTGSLIVLGERIVKVLIFVFGAFAVLSVLGVNMTTALAGVGIGGLAIGFGAQKTIENLFGGVSVLGDEVIRVGDYCRFGDKAGTVEDIGLRSTRIRTPERTLVAIPNGTVATINVENFSRRDKILFNIKFGLHTQTKADQLRFVLAELRRLLYSHAKVETDSARVRLTDVDGSSHTVEIFAYVLTQDANEYAAIREDLLLRMMDVIDESGSALAVPSQTLYLGKDAGLEKEKAKAAAKQISDLREGKQLPFPDHHKDDIAGFKGTIQYPQADSAVSNDKRGSSNSR